MKVNPSPRYKGYLWAHLFCRERCEKDDRGYIPASNTGISKQPGGVMAHVCTHNVQKNMANATDQNFGSWNKDLSTQTIFMCFLVPLLLIMKNAADSKMLFIPA